MWDIFQAVYQLNDLMIKISLSIKFYFFKMREGESVDQFVANFRLFRFKLVQSGIMITD